MNLTFDVTSALAALVRVLPASDKRGQIPIHSHVLLSVDALGTALVRATSADMDASATFPAQGVGNPIALPAATLTDILRNLPLGADAKLSWGDGDVRVKLQCGRSRFQLGFLPTDQWPSSVTNDWAVETVIDPKAYMRALKAVAWAASKETVKYAIMGVNVDITANEMRMIATDAKVISEYRLPCATSAINTTIPNKFVVEMQRFLSEAKGEVWLSLRKGRIAVRDDGGEIAGQTIDMPYPSVAKVIVRTSPHNISVSREALIVASKRVVSATGGGDIGIKMHISPNAFGLSANGDVGDGSDELTAEGGDAEQVVGITDHYLLEALANMEGERVTIGYDGEKPFSLRGSDDRALITMGTRRV